MGLKEIVEESWAVYKRNWTSFIASQLLILLFVSVVLLLFFFLPISFTFIPSFTIFSFFSISPIHLAFLFVIGFLLLLAIGMFVIGTYYMGKLALRRRISLKVFFEGVKKYFFRYLVANAIVGLILVSGIIIVVASIFLNIALFFVLLVVYTLLTILFVFVPILIVFDYSPLESIKLSVRLCRKNYLRVWSLALFFILISVVISLMPYVGSLINFLMINPLMVISYIILYKNLRRSVKR
ncbi:MAG: hypothetical protein J7L39_01585 [Candidatus Aenigmarchaeota archaeon]|nr:hypothetical protein [Candidatus Aenigmarchaeota archaeon]